MDSLRELAAVVALFVLRLGVPLGVTLLVGWLLHRLDLSWQAELAEERKQAMQTDRLQPAVRCWEVWHCPVERLRACPAYTHRETPCWQHFRDSSNRLREACLSCQVFRTALPMAA